MYNVLLVDDDESILEINEYYLTQLGYNVLTTRSIKETVKALSWFEPHCIVLDILLPDGNTTFLCKQIKGITNAPIIFLSNLTFEAQKIAAFEEGGSDYVTKPFSTKELSMRIARRIQDNLASSKPDNVMQFGELCINVSTREVTVAGTLLDLTSKEFNILALLSRNADKAFTLNDIYSAVWGMYDVGNPHNVQIHISNLRKKLKKASPKTSYLKTVWGNGYRFVSSPLNR